MLKCRRVGGIDVCEDVPEDEESVSPKELYRQLKDSGFTSPRH